MTKSCHSKFGTIQKVKSYEPLLKPDEKHDIYLASFNQMSDFVLEGNPLPGNFILVVWLDSEAHEDVWQLAHFAEKMLKWGAVSAECGGSACELLHDIFDEVIVESEVMDPLNERRFPEYVYDLISTSWYTNEPLGEVLWSSINASFLPEGIEDENLPVLVLAFSPHHKDLTPGLLDEMD